MAGDRSELGKPDAVVMVVVRQGLVLVGQRGPGTTRSGYWAPLSGRVDPGESQPQTVVREAREEVGLAVTPVAKVWECDTDDGAFRLHWWLAEAGPGELVLDPAEVSEARWITAEEFASLSPTFAEDRDFFATVFPGLRR